MWGQFSPAILDEDRQIAGAETALIHVSRELARLGHNVTVFYNVDKPGKYDGVAWRKLRDYNPRECYDVLVAWEHPAVFQWQPCAFVTVLEMQCSDQPWLRPDYRIDGFVPLSNWHRDFFCRRRGVDPRRCYPIPNGIDLSRYKGHVEKESHRLIWSSSPDRGLHHLLRMWPEIRKAVPDAELHVFYSMKAFEQQKWAMNKQAADLWYIKTHLDQDGVVYRGAVGKKTLAQEQMKASLLAYPCDPAFPSETFCITALEACAAGLPLILSDADCLPEIYGEIATILPRPIDYDQWIVTIIKALRDDEWRQEQGAKGRRFARRYTWQRVGKMWEKYLIKAVEMARNG